MQRLGSIDAWRKLTVSQKLQFSINKNKSRTIRVEVSTPPLTEWYCELGKQKMFVTTTTGYDKFEITVPKGVPFSLQAGKDCIVIDNENAAFHVEDTGKPKHTVITERRGAPTDLELMVRKASMNLLRTQDVRYAQLQREMEELSHKQSQKIQELERQANERDQREADKPASAGGNVGEAGEPPQGQGQNIAPSGSQQEDQGQGEASGQG